MAQIHALLFISARPLNAEEICETLGVARSNVSNSLRELQNWKIVKMVHLPGDRRDHFVAETDLWELLMRISSERKRREIDPTVQLLAQLAEDLDGHAATPAHIRDRIVRMHEFIGTLGNWYDQVRGLPKPTLVTLMKLGAKVARFVPGLGKEKT